MAQLLLAEPAHHVAGAGLLALALLAAHLAGEAVVVEQRHEEVEVLGLAAVRCRRHQQEVARDLAEAHAQLVALGLLDLVAEVVRRHLVGLVADHEVPLALRELGHELLVAREVIEARDQQVLLEERVAGVGGVDHLARDDLEAEVELLAQLVLPLIDEHARADDRARAWRRRAPSAP